MGAAGARVALALLCLCGCASRPLAAPSLVQDAWYRVEGPAFSIYTDLDRDDAARVAAELERTYAAMLAVGWDAKGTPIHRAQVVLFHDEKAYRYFGGDKVVGYYTPYLVFTRWAVTFAGAGFATLEHELTHHVAIEAIPHEPVWFAEGIATYFETAHFEHDAFILGDAPDGFYALLSQDGIMPCAELLAFTGVPDIRVYASAWLLTHYLLHERGPGFARYQAALAAGASATAAWTDAFPDLSPERLDALLPEHLWHHANGYTASDYRAPLPTVQVSALSTADVESLQAVLEVTCRSCAHSADVVRAHVQSALRSDPAALDALRRDELDHALDLSARALDADPIQPDVLASRAAILQATHHCDELTKLGELVTHTFTDEADPRMREYVQKQEQACTTPDQ